jgi:hypothetical protein
MTNLKDRDPTPPEGIDDETYVEVLENMTGTQIADWLSKHDLWDTFCAEHIAQAERIIDEKAGER